MQNHTRFLHPQTVSHINGRQTPEKSCFQNPPPPFPFIPTPFLPLLLLSQNPIKYPLPSYIAIHQKKKKSRHQPPFSGSRADKLGRSLQFPGFCTKVKKKFYFSPRFSLWNLNLRCHLLCVPNLFFFPVIPTSAAPVHNSGGYRVHLSSFQIFFWQGQLTTDIHAIRLLHSGRKYVQERAPNTPSTTDKLIRELNQ